MTPSEVALARVELAVEKYLGARGVSLSPEDHRAFHSTVSRELLERDEEHIVVLSTVPPRARRFAVRRVIDALVSTIHAAAATKQQCYEAASLAFLSAIASLQEVETPLSDEMATLLAIVAVTEDEHPTKDRLLYLFCGQPGLSQEQYEPALQSLAALEIVAIKGDTVLLREHCYV